MRKVAALIIPLRWFRRKEVKQEPAHIKPMVDAAIWNIVTTTGSVRR